MSRAATKPTDDHVRTNIQVLNFTFYVIIIIETVTQDMPQVTELFDKF